MNSHGAPPTASTSRMYDAQLAFDDKPILDYLRLGDDYRPQPSTDPITFLQRNQHLKRLPPHLISSFSAITTPKQRTVVPTIRNRRLRYTNSQPAEFEFERARDAWPDLWQGNVQDWRNVAERENRDERAWAQSQFLGGEKQHVGKLGSLLGDYEEERTAERLRGSRKPVTEEFIPEEEDSDDDEEDEEIVTGGNIPDDSPEEVRANFERLIRERFIYGLLQANIYDSVDWNDQWDSDNERFEEERWFDDEEEGI